MCCGRRMTVWIAAGLLIALAGRLDAQSSTVGSERQLGVTLGYAYGGTRDQALSPRLYSGSGTAFETFYGRRGARGSMEFRLSGLALRPARPTDEHSSLTGLWFDGQLEFLWRTASTMHDRLFLFAGGAVSAQLSYRDHEHGDAPGPVGQPPAFQARASTMVTSLEGVAAWRFVASPRTALSQRVDVAIAGIVIRPEAINQDVVQYGSESAGPGRLRQICNVFGMDHTLSPSLAVLVRVRTDLLRTQDGLPLADARHSLSFGFAHRFRNTAR